MLLAKEGFLILFSCLGLYNTLAIVNGFPAISFYDIVEGKLYYVQALDSLGMFCFSKVDSFFI